MSELTGAILKKIREDRHIPLEQVASATRIRLELLRDLEDEEYDSIASSAQRKGFFRLYTEFLKLSSEEIELYTNQVESSQSQKTEINAAIQDSQELTSSPITTPQSIKPEAPTITQPPEPASKPVPEAKSPEPVKPSLGSLLLGKAKSAQEQPVLVVEGSRSQTLLAEIGKQLTERRRYLNISWDLISNQVRIPRDQLQALERGDLAYFSNSMQAKGYLQNYAQFLNLDKDAILVQFAGALQLHRLESAKKPLKAPREAKVLSPVMLVLKKFFTLDLFFGSFLIVGMLGFLVWGMARMASTRAAVPVQTPLPDLAQVLAETRLPTTNSSTESAPLALLTQETPEILPTATPLYIPIVSDDPVQLVLIPNSQEWVRIFVDGEQVFTGRLEAGKAVQYTAKDGILLETGNAAGFTAILNNQEIQGFGPIGTLARVSFTANGMSNLSIQPLQTQPTEGTTNPLISPTESQPTQTINP
jgi:cytoskeleton protein RodZ